MRNWNIERTRARRREGMWIAAVVGLAVSALLIRAKTRSVEAEYTPIGQFIDKFDVKRNRERAHSLEAIDGMIYDLIRTRRADPVGPHARRRVTRGRLQRRHRLARQGDALLLQLPLRGAQHRTLVCLGAAELPALDDQRSLAQQR